MKKKPARKNVKYAALDPKYNLKTRTEHIDYDYIGKLSEKEKAWLNAFTEEYVNANMKHKGKKLHKTKASKKDCYNRNNSRNRDILSRAKASGKFHYLEDIFNNEADLNEILRDAANLEEQSDEGYYYWDDTGNEEEGT